MTIRGKGIIFLTISYGELQLTLLMENARLL